MLALTARLFRNLIRITMTTRVAAAVRNMGVTLRKCPKNAGYLGLVYAIRGRSVRAVAQNVCGYRLVILTYRASLLCHSCLHNY